MIGGSFDMKKTLTLDERMELKRKRLKGLKRGIIITSVLSVILLPISLLGGLGGALCYIVLIFGTIFFPIILVQSLLYLQMKNQIKGYDRMWEEFRAVTIEQGLEPVRDSPQHISEVLNKCATKDHFIRYAIFGTKQDIWGRVVWTWFWKALDHHGSGDDHIPTHEYLVAMTHLQNIKGWVTVRRESHLGGTLFEDIDFEDPVFSRKFFVKASSKKLAYDFFHPRMMDLWKKKCEYRFEIRDGWLILFDTVSKNRIFQESIAGFTYDVSHLTKFQEKSVEFMEEIIDLIPNYMKGHERFEAIEMKDGIRSDVVHDGVLEL
jgi:hypothetical protein